MSSPAQNQHRVLTEILNGKTGRYILALGNYINNPDIEAKLCLPFAKEAIQECVDQMSDRTKLQLLLLAIKLSGFSKTLRSALRPGYPVNAPNPAEASTAAPVPHQSDTSSLGVSFPTGSEAIPSLAAHLSSTTTSGALQTIAPAHNSPPASSNATGSALRPPPGTQGLFTATSLPPVASGSGQYPPTPSNASPGPSSPELTRSATKRKHATVYDEDWAKVMQMRHNYQYLPPSALDTREARERAEKLNAGAVHAPLIRPVAQPPKKSSASKAKKTAAKKDTTAVPPPTSAAPPVKARAIKAKPAKTPAAKLAKSTVPPPAIPAPISASVDVMFTATRNQSGSGSSSSLSTPGFYSPIPSFPSVSSSTSSSKRRKISPVQDHTSAGPSTLVASTSTARPTTSQGFPMRPPAGPSPLAAALPVMALPGTLPYHLQYEEFYQSPSPPSPVPPPKSNHASGLILPTMAMEGFSLLLGPKSARPAFSPTVSSSALPTETQAVQDPQADSNDTPYICDLFGDVPDDADYGDLFSE